MPILVGLDGKEKMSKSKGNYVGVTDTPTNMFGKIMSISDEMMENYFTLLTDLSADEIATLLDGQKTHPKTAKVTLAKIIVKQFYNEATADLAAKEFEQVFAKGQIPDEMPKVELDAEPVMLSKLVLTCGLVETSSEAKRMIKQAAVSIDGQKMTDPNEMITPTDDMVLQVGKRKFAKIKVK